MLKQLLKLLIIGIILTSITLAYINYTDNTKIIPSTKTIEKPLVEKQIAEEKTVEKTIITETTGTVTTIEEISSSKTENDNEDDGDNDDIENENIEETEPVCEECQTEENLIGLTPGYLTDYNNDGIEDMVRTEMDRQTYVYINKGTNQSPIYEGGVLIE